MAQSLTKIYLHIIFGAFEHAEIIPKGSLNEVHAYIAGTLKNCNCYPVAVGGTASHVHVLCEMSSQITVSDLIRNIKISSSKWIKEHFPGHQLFSWQNGYAAFSVSRSNIDAVKKYILTQEEHHKGRSVKEELIGFLQKHEVAYDERYI